MKIWLLICTLLVSSWALAETNIHTIQLKHRLAAEVLPQVKAFLPETATIRAHNNLLILKADRATVANVQQLLEQLDKPQLGVIVSVMRSSEEFDRQRGGSEHIRIDAGDDIRASAGINRWSTRDRQDQNQQYHARGVAGYPLSITLGEDIPQQQQLVFVGPRGVAVASDTHYISSDNGFRAVPYLLPDGQVRVEIHPFFSKLSRVDGDIRSSDVITTVVGQQGQWLEIGRITENADIERDRVTTSQSHGEQTQIIYLKVETSN